MGLKDWQAALEHVKDAAGSLRAQIEALLSMGLPNSPMQGSRIRVCSGNFVIARPLGVVDGVDYQHTGKVRRIDVDAIHRQLRDDAIVLLSPLGYSPTGEIFNLALEDIAVSCAAAIGADKLVLFGAEAGIVSAGGDLLRQLTHSFPLTRSRPPCSTLRGAPVPGAYRAAISSATAATVRCWKNCSPTTAAALWWPRAIMSSRGAPPSRTWAASWNSSNPSSRRVSC